MKIHANIKLSSALDTFAVGLSGLCLIHCLILPLLVALFPLLGATLMSHEAFHQIILIAVVPTTAIALGLGYRRHRHLPVAILGVTGIGALVLAAFALHSLRAHYLETWITVAGGIVLALAHISNFRRCRHGYCAPHHLSENMKGHELC
ncbi:MAG TPA: MerC domain-containing protein [Salinisphaeraceae bacterium]|nr:MerC domain-containing protein [Salinisphaeraceae bacterium]